MEGRRLAGGDYNYGDSIVAVGETGTVREFDNFTAYLLDPSAWLEEQLDDSGAKSKMAFKLRKGGDDIYAYLVSVSGE